MKKTPIYIKIYNDLKEKIDSGLLPVGTRLPSERKLAEEFQVNRLTLRQAIQLLAEEGILEKHIGSGTYVASTKVQEKMKGTTSFTEIILSQGKTPSSKTIAYFKTIPSIHEQKKLHLKKEDEIIKMERVRYADHFPICYEVAVIPANLVKNYKKEEITSSFYHTLIKNNYQIGNAEQTISATVATEHIAELLQMDRGDAILRLHQVTFFNDKNHTPFEYVRSQYVGKRFEFYLKK